MPSFFQIFFHRCRNHSGPWYRVNEGGDQYLRNFPELGIGSYYAEDMRNCLICGHYQSRHYEWDQGQPDPCPNILRLDKLRPFTHTLITPGGGVLVNDPLQAKEVIEATRRDRD